MNTGKAITTIMKKRKTKAQDLAEYVGVSRQTIQAWKSGAVEAGVSQLQLIADYHKITFSYLVHLGKEVKASEIDENAGWLNNLEPVQDDAETIIKIHDCKVTGRWRNS